METASIFALIPVLLLMADSTIAQKRSDGACTDFEVQSNFDFTRYLGKWHGYSKYPTLRFARNNCSTVFYSDASQPGGIPTIAVLNRGYSDKTGVYSRAYGQASPVDPSQPARLAVRFYQSRRPTTSATAANYNVLSTDYNNYAVVYSCRQVNENEKYELLFVLTRERIPSQHYVDQAYDAIRRQGLDTEALRNNIQADCPEPDR